MIEHLVTDHKIGPVPITSKALIHPRGSISSPTTAELGSTARRLVLASVSPNTRESYTRALRQFDTWRGHRPLGP